MGGETRIVKKVIVESHQMPSMFAERGSCRGKDVGPGEGATTPYDERIGVCETADRWNLGSRARAASTSMVSLPGGNGYLLVGLIGETTVGVSER